MNTDHDRDETSLPTKLTLAPLVVQEAFDQLPTLLHPRGEVELLKHTARGNIVCKFETMRSTNILKLFRAAADRSPLLPPPGDCASKEAWLATLPQLRGCIPSIHHTGRLTHESETLSFLVQDFAAGESAANSICAESDAIAFTTELGRFCRTLHGISVNGFGAVFLPCSEHNGAFTARSWTNYVEQRLNLCGIQSLADTSAKLRNVVDKVRNRTIPLTDAIAPTLFHHDLLHNWSNVIVHPGTARIANVIDWDQCGSGNALALDLGVARFALRNRRDGAFGWSTFLRHFLIGYGVELGEYRDTLIQSVNAFSTLYAARSACLFPDRQYEFESYILEALNNDLF